MMDYFRYKAWWRSFKVPVNNYNGKKLANKRTSDLQKMYLISLV